MMEKALFWGVLVWMIGLLILGIIAVRDIWKDATADEKQAESASGENLTTTSREDDGKREQTPRQV